MGDLVIRNISEYTLKYNIQIIDYLVDSRLEQNLLICILNDQNEFLNLKNVILNYIYGEVVNEDNPYCLKRENTYLVFLIKDTVNCKNKNLIESDRLFMKKYLIDECKKDLSNFDSYKNLLLEKIPCLAPIKDILKGKEIEYKGIKNKIETHIKEDIKLKYLNKILKIMDLEELSKKFKRNIK